MSKETIKVTTTDNIDCKLIVNYSFETSVNDPDRYVEWLKSNATNLNVLSLEIKIGDTVISLPPVAIFTNEIKPHLSFSTVN